MFKLLSPEQKKKVVSEYDRRRTVVFLLAFAVAIILGAGALFPTYISIVSRANELQNQVSQLSNSRASTEAGELKAWAESVRHKLAILSPSSDTDKPYELYTSILGIKPKGIKVTGISWFKKGNAVTITVSGVASTRQDLLDFENGLNTLAPFASDTFPLSDLAQNSEINFQFDLAVH